MADTMMDTDYGNDAQDCMDSKSAGRWTSEEHTLFLQGLQLYNKQWKYIADLVKTRTVVQIRTHAQKYFQKLEKGKAAGMKKDGAMFVEGPGSPTTEYKNASSRTSSISSSDSFDSNGNGSTTSEGESDNERAMSIGSFEDSSHLVLTLPNTKSRKSKAESPKKRTRDGKPTESKATKGGKKAVAASLNDSIDFPIPHDMGVDEDALFDFMQLDKCEIEDLDNSIINLLEKIDWNMSTSRPHSPFMDSANSVTGSDSWDISHTNVQNMDIVEKEGTSCEATSSLLSSMMVSDSNSCADKQSHSKQSLTALQTTEYDIKSNNQIQSVLPLVSPTTISSGEVFSPSNIMKACAMPISHTTSENFNNSLSSFSFDGDDSEADSSCDSDQPRKRGRPRKSPSATNIALIDHKQDSGVTDSIGDKFDDFLDSGILLDSF